MTKQDLEGEQGAGCSRQQAVQRSCGWKALCSSEAWERKAEGLEGRAMVWGSLVTALPMPILILGTDTRERLPKKNEAGVCAAGDNLPQQLPHVQ